MFFQKFKIDPHDHLKAVHTFCTVMDKFIMVIGVIDFFGKLHFVTSAVTVVVFYLGSYKLSKSKVINVLEG